MAPFGHPHHADPQRFHLVAPFEKDPARWLRGPWIDLHTGDRYDVTTTGQPTAGRARIQSIGDLVERYRIHPEPKSADGNGNPCGPTTVGLLARRRVVVGKVVHIGKEANDWERVQAGAVHDWDDVLTIYENPADDDWAIVVAHLKAIPLRVLAQGTGYSERYLKMVRNGHRMPSTEARGKLRLLIEAGDTLAV